MKWEETVHAYGELVEEELKKYFAEALERARLYHPYVEYLYRSLEELTMRKGKRLASCSSLATYKGYTQTIDNGILKVACAIELYRHCILVHDDLVDQDDSRRGGKALHRILEEGFDERFGASATVFTGNLLYALTLRCLGNSGFSSPKLSQVFNVIGEGYQHVNESQILDLLFEYKIPTVEEWRVMVSKRAASLFRTTLEIGGVLGDASDQDISLLREVGRHIGYAFDIQDDIIDLYATEEQYGRKPGGDLLHKKKPLHMIYFYHKAGEERLKKLNEILVKGYTSEEEIQQIRCWIREAGALKAAKDEASNHASAAERLIRQTSLNEEAKAFFSSLISYIYESMSWYA